MPPVQSPFLPGDVVAGKYRVERQLGAGGMGVVLAATHLDLLEPRALKFLSDAALEDAESVERFLREARAASRLKSEHVTHVYDVGRLPTGIPFMVMEYLEGTDLGGMLKTTGRISTDVAVDYMLQAMEGLAEAHAMGIVHRDLKPANLFLTYRPDGTHCVKVLDFGISKIKSGEDIDVTKTHAVLGSPHYMSPEQMESSRDVDVRSDIWSLGIILYQLTTGELPFKGKTMTEVVAVVFSKPPIPPTKLVEGYPPELESIILACLKHDVNARPQNVGELATALAPFGGPSASHVVERIWRLLQAPVGLRLSASNPAIASQFENLQATRTPLPGAVPMEQRTPLPSGRSTPSPVASSPPAGIPVASGFSERMNDVTLQQPGSVTGAWGGTASGTKRRRIPAAAILLACGAMLLGVAVAIAIVMREPPRPAEPPVSSVIAMASTPPSPPVESVPDASAAPEAPASAAPSAVVTASATASTPTRRLPVRKTAPAPTSDPFGMDRK
ncbi:MAG: serine/threonine protein kinase [Polyangiaceae bacterium]|nr:serine/threonine protein kinase [Polyangiaceae bacterium]